MFRIASLSEYWGWLVCQSSWCCGGIWAMDVQGLHATVGKSSYLPSLFPLAQHNPDRQAFTKEPRFYSPLEHTYPPHPRVKNNPFPMKLWHTKIISCKDPN